MGRIFSGEVLFDRTYRNLERAVKEMNWRTAVHTHNLANAATPGFKPVQFYEELNIAKDKLNKKIEWITPEQEMDHSYDKVDIQRELQALKDLAVKQKSLLRLMKLKESIVINIMRQGK